MNSIIDVENRINNALMNFIHDQILMPRDNSVKVIAFTQPI